MKLLLRIILFSATNLFCFQFLCAQNFSVLNKDRVYYYEKSGKFYAVAVDSVKFVDNDSVYYHFLNFRDTVSPQMNVCVDVYGGSFFGKINIKDSTGAFYLVTFRNDTVKLLPDAALYDSWRMYTYSNGSYLEATITGIDTLIVFDHYELVKNISITAKNINGTPITTQPFNGKNLLLSELNGLLNTFDFYMFPTDTTRYNLKGVTNPAVGKVMTYKIYFDFDEGDVFHIVESDLYYVWDGGTSMHIFSGYIRRYIQTVIEKTTYNPDTAVSYKFALCTQMFVYTQGIKDTLYSTDTVFTSYNYNQAQDTTFALLPFQTFFNNSDFFYYKPILYLQRDNNMSGRLNHIYYDRTDIAFSDSCWQYICADPMPPSHKYLEGCGGPYSYYEDWMYTIEERKLQYYKKGNEIWGVPLAADCSDMLSSIITNRGQAVRFNVYPNPVNTELFLEIPISSEFNIDIFNMYGKLVYKTKTNALNIDVSQLSSGMYFIQLTDKQKRTYVSRFIKQ